MSMEKLFYMQIKLQKVSIKPLKKQTEEEKTKRIQ